MTYEVVGDELDVNFFAIGVKNTENGEINVNCSEGNFMKLAI